MSPCTFNASRVHSYPYLKRPIWAQITRDTTLMLGANSLAKSMSLQPDGGNAESKQLMFKVGWKYPLSHRLNDTIALHRALRQQPPPYPPLACTHPRSPSHRSSTFETPFAGYQMYFSYASFSDINYGLHPSLSCIPWRDAVGAATMEGTHAEYNLVCTQVFLFFLKEHFYA